MEQRKNNSVSSVTLSILEQGRRAMLSGKPILHIKTDSDILISRIVNTPSMPLVVLRGGDERLKNRPLSGCVDHAEMLTGDDSQDLISSGIFKSGGQVALPGMDKAIAYKTAKDQDEDSEHSYYYPRLWVQKLPEYDEHDAESKREWKALNNTLEAFIREYRNPRYEGGNPEAIEALHSSAVIIYGRSIHLSNMLAMYTESIEVPYPNKADIEALIKYEIGGMQTIKKEILENMVESLLGLSEEEILICLQDIIAGGTLEDEESIMGVIQHNKKQKMESGDLEWCIPQSNIAGMTRYKKWIDKIKEPVKYAVRYRRTRGTLPPKGVLLCGIPGCGKSEAAKFTAATLGLSLLRLDMGKMMDKFQGESERKLRDNIALAEAMSPCVLWLDEIEKAMGEAKSGGGNDNGVFKRMFGFLLTWMQENTKPVFLFATANDISGLPKEFFRSGRFDELYAVYLPTEGECKGIFKSCMKRNEKNADVKALFDKDCYADQLLGEVINSMVKPAAPGKNDRKSAVGMPRIMIGSDIEKIVKRALMDMKLNDGHIIGADEWKNALKASCLNCGVYGDSSENVDSIAVSYCRVLRKGFQPTADLVLIRPEDYHGENLRKMNERRKDEKKYTEEETQILMKKEPNTKSEYDKAIYHCLFERINEFAPLIEENARNEMTR